jgi:hypothetical protein
MDDTSVPELPQRPSSAGKAPAPAASPDPEIAEQARMLREYEEKQAALKAAQEAELQRRRELEQQQQREYEEMQRLQAERERLAQEQLLREQAAHLQNQAAGRAHELEREMLAMRSQYERDQLLLEQYDRVSLSLLLTQPSFPDSMVPEG